jgi:hypothetical protein
MNHYCKNCHFVFKKEFTGNSCFVNLSLDDKIKITQEDHRLANHMDLLLALNFDGKCVYYKEKVY